MKPLRILIVDDHPVNLKLLRTQLEAEGHTILDARNGVEALAVLERETIEAIVSDILMPVMDGYRLCYEVRHDVRFRDLPFIAYTSSYVSDSDERLSLDLGADCYLRKPASVENLVRCIAEALAHPGRRPVIDVDTTDVLKEYSERLVDKLEERNVKLAEVAEQMQRQASALLTAIAVGKHSEDQLRDALGQLRELLDHSPAVIYALRVEGETITPGLVSANITRLLGFPVAETQAPGWWAGHVHPDDRSRAYAQIPQTLSHGVSRTEYRMRHRDGTYRWVDDNLRLVQKAAGGAAELAGVWTDITDRRQAEDELHESERRSREMLDNLDLVSVMLDRNGRITYCNDYFLRLTGWERVELLGKDWLSIFLPPEEIVETRLALSSLLTNNPEAWHHTNTILTRTGERRLLQWNNSVLRSPFGDIVGVASIGEDITSRTLAERELHTSEEHLRIIVRASNDAVWEFDTKTGEGRWSDRAYSILGYSPEEIRPTYQNYLALIHPDDVSVFQQAINAHLERDEPYQVRLRLRHSSGSFISILSRGQLQRESGQMVGLFTDLSIVERAEDQIREQAALIDQAHDAIVVRDLEDRITFWSKGAERLYGWLSSEALGRRLNELLHIDAERFETAKQEVLTGGARTGEVEKTTASGRIVTVSCSRTLLLDERGQPKAILTLDTDISDQKTAERQLEESEERYRLLFDRNPLPSWVYDTETLSFLAVNDAAVLHYGHSREEFLRMTIRDIRPPEEISKMLKVVEDQGESATPKAYGVFTHQKKDGTRIDVEIASSGITFAGRPAGLVLAHDITERRRIEQQFLRAQRLESLGTLAGGIAHDLNNLLMPILMGVTLLKRLGPDARSLKTIDNIESSVKRGTDLVKRILLFASGTKGERKVVDLRTIVAEIKAFSQSSFPKNISFATTMPDGLSNVIGDPTQLTQVLLNLCVNARDAMPRGGRLTISGANTEIDEPHAVPHGRSAGHYVVLEVNDDGSGIPPAVIERMFDPFFTTKEVGKGTGLGLSTVQGVLRSHGGFIEVKSELGHGTTFCVYLPAHAHAAAETAGQEETIPLSRGHGETILVVDDEPPILSVARQALEAFGYDVVTANEGAEALSLYARDQVNIAAVLSDMMMPAMDGAALIPALRQLNPDVRIIAMSGQTDPELIAGIAIDRATAFLSKPFSAEVLLRTLSELLASPPVTTKPAGIRFSGEGILDPLGPARRGGDGGHCGA